MNIIKNNSAIKLFRLLPLFGGSALSPDIPKGSSMPYGLNSSMALFASEIGDELHLDQDYRKAEPIQMTKEVQILHLGSVYGIVEKAFKSKYEAFLGIPFAQPPVKSLRFANPKPVKPWKTPLNATKQKPMCIQKNYLLGMETPVVGQEDCLYLNIYRPENAEDNLPVMVYIHGGGFFYGDTSNRFHGPEYFMDTKRVILVVIAYRLGPLGFLSTGDRRMSGNFGLKDQRLALRFVSQHIHSFGGDRNKVTIFGHDAGAVSCHLHMLSYASKGLFDQAILMSGNALASYNEPIKNPLEQARLLGKYVGLKWVKKLTTASLTEKLRTFDARKIVQAGDMFKHWRIDPLVVFRNVIEPQENMEPFMTEHPRKTSSSKGYRTKPFLNTFVPFESAIRTLNITEDRDEVEEFNDHFIYLISMLLDVPTQDAYESHYSKVMKHYGLNIYRVNEKNQMKFGQLLTDYTFYYPMYETIKTYLQDSKPTSSPLFLLKFNYKGPRSFSELITRAKKKKKYGVVHLDDLIYLFRMHGVEKNKWPPFEIDSVDFKVTMKYVTLFADFAGHKYTKLQQCTKDEFFNNVHSNTGICTYVNFHNNGTEEDDLRIDKEIRFDIKAMDFWEQFRKTLHT